MALPTTNVTRFPGGVGQFTVITVGVAANGNMTLTGLKTTDNLLFVQTQAFDADVDAGAVVDVTDRCEIIAADQVHVKDDGGADLSGRMALVTFTRPVA